MPQDGSLASIFLGLGGVSTEDDRRDILGILADVPEAGQAGRIVVENDTVAGLTGGLSGRPGLTLIAGTGSICLGINPTGERRLCGGWGALADDVGSAPWVGLRALQAAVRAEDGRGAPTLLRAIVFDFLSLSEPRQLISRVHNHGLERAELGRLAPLVTDACRPRRRRRRGHPAGRRRGPVRDGPRDRRASLPGARPATSSWSAAWRFPGPRSSRC